MLVYKRHIITGKVNSMDLPVTQKQLDIYENTNTLVQDVFPDLDADQREFLISGYLPGEWESSMEFLTEEDDSNYVKGGLHD